MTDLRRERALINKKQAQYGRVMGTSVRYAQYDSTTSVKDVLYDDGGVGGRKYKTLVTVPFLWLDNIEGAVNQTALRVDKSDNVRGGVSYDQLRGAGVLDLLNDDAHVLDIFYWGLRDQWYRVDDWEVLGIYGTDPVVIGITGVQTFPDEEYLSEAFPPNGRPPVT